MKSKDEIIHELEQQVSDMAMEITRLKKQNEELKKCILSLDEPVDDEDVFDSPII